MKLFTKIKDFFKQKNVYNYTDIISRRQLETFLKLEENNNVKLNDVIYMKESEKALLVCSDNIIIDYDGLVSYDSTGFYPIDWTPFSDIMLHEDEILPGWSNSPIHEEIRAAGLDEILPIHEEIRAAGLDE